MKALKNGVTPLPRITMILVPLGSTWSNWHFNMTYIYLYLHSYFTLKLKCILPKNPFEFWNRKHLVSQCSLFLHWQYCSLFVTSVFESHFLCVLPENNMCFGNQTDAVVCGRMRLLVVCLAHCTRAWKQAQSRTFCGSASRCVKSLFLFSLLPTLKGNHCNQCAAHRALFLYLLFVHFSSLFMKPCKCGALS